MQILQDLANDLVLYSSGKMSQDEVMRKYPMENTIPEIEAVMSNLCHYFADADIRMRDEKYKFMQESEMKKLISLLRSNSSIDQINTITFLHFPDGRHE
jgi:hypothetical protein